MDCKCKDVPIQTPIKRLFIGSLGACAVASKHGITTIISVCDHDVANKDPKIKHHFVKVADDDKNFVSKTRALRFLLLSLHRNPNEQVMVRCEDGHNRSAALICSFAMRSFRVPLDLFLKAMRLFKPCVKPCATFMTQLRVFEANLFKPSFEPIAQKGAWGGAPI